MTDREKVIKAIELEIKHENTWECRKECPYYGKTDCNCFTQVLVDALELLKEQEPLVIHKCGFTAQCPECRTTWMMWQPENMRYCPGCGRRVKWDD